MRPVLVVTFMTLWPLKSEMYKFPDVSMVTPAGSASVAAVARTPFSVEPLPEMEPATVLRIPYVKASCWWTAFLSWKIEIVAEDDVAVEVIEQNANSAATNTMKLTRNILLLEKLLLCPLSNKWKMKGLLKVIFLLPNTQPNNNFFLIVNESILC